MDLYEKQEAAVKTSYQPIGMIHSHSEGSIAFRSKPGAIDTSRFNPVISKQNESYAKFGEGVDSSLRSPTRGRTTSRTPSPVKYLDDVPEDQMLDITPSSTKRARSPIKKMFGENGWLGRSTSMKEIPTDQSRKTGLKNWGGKLKQRVEDLVRHPDFRVCSTGSCLHPSRPMISPSSSQIPSTTPVLSLKVSSPLNSQSRSIRQPKLSFTPRSSS